VKRSGKRPTPLCSNGLPFFRDLTANRAASTPLAPGDSVRAGWVTLFRPAGCTRCGARSRTTPRYFHVPRQVPSNADSNEPEPANLLEVQGRMLRISPQQLIRLVGEAAYAVRELAIAVPKPLIGAVPHRSVQRPARRSSSASSARASRRPAATSSSIRRSHASASSSANHTRNAASSAAESLRAASSISFTLPIPSSLLCAVARVQLHLFRGVGSGSRIDPAGTATRAARHSG
jgi:hypothetical protein